MAVLQHTVIIIDLTNFSHFQAYFEHEVALIGVVKGGLCPPPPKKITFPVYSYVAIDSFVVIR